MKSSVPCPHWHFTSGPTPLHAGADPGGVPQLPALHQSIQLDSLANSDIGLQFPFTRFE